MDLALLWLWRKPTATVPIGPLAWELPYAEGAAVKKKEEKKKNHLLRSSLVAQQIKDPALSLQWLGSMLWQGKCRQKKKNHLFRQGWPKIYLMWLYSW